MTRLNNICPEIVNHRVTNKPYCLIHGKEFEVPNGHLGWYPKILYRFVDQLDAMLSSNRCVMVIRADLRLGFSTQDNKIMTTFWRRLSKTLKKRYPQLKLGYIWVREQERAKHQHYHIMIMVDKDLIHYSNTITTAIIKVWKNLSGSQAHIPKNCYYSVKRNDTDSFLKPVERASYLAKSRGKGYRSKQTKDYGSSRLR